MGARLVKNKPHPSKLVSGIENERRFYFARCLQLSKAIGKFKETQTAGDMLAMFELAEDTKGPVRINPGKHRG